MALIQASGYQGYFVPNAPAVIPISDVTSGIIQCNGKVLCGVQLPATFTGTALSFLVSADGVSYVVLKSTVSGTTLSYTVAQGTYCAIDPKDFQGVNFLKIVSGTTELAARTLLCALKGF